MYFSLSEIMFFYLSLSHQLSSVIIQYDGNLIQKSEIIDVTFVPNENKSSLCHSV